MKWIKEYLTKSSVMRIFYGVVVAHGAVQLLMLFGISQQRILLGLFVASLLVSVLALLRFVDKLIWFHGVKEYPSNAFTYVMLETIPNIIIASVLGIPSASALLKYNQHLPLTWAGILFVYAYSISFWMFFFMSRLLNKKD